MSAPAFTLTASQTPLLFAGFMTDDTRSLAIGLRQRDPDLLDRLIEQYQQRLYRYLLFLTGNPSLAEDLFQETWIRVLERGSQYNASRIWATRKATRPTTHPMTAQAPCCKCWSAGKTNRAYNFPS